MADLVAPVRARSRGRRPGVGARFGALGAIGLLTIAAVGAAPPASGIGMAQDSERQRAMNRPADPFRVAGNLYSVGASSVTSFLLVSDAGHVLIDGGFPETAPVILANIAALGFDPADVSVLLASHAHFDHAGGLAALKAATGARLMVSAADARLVESGGRGDPLMGDGGTFPPARVDHVLADGEVVRVGELELTAHLTAGHTEGCTSWSFPVDDAGVRRMAVSVCSVTVLPGVVLTGSPTYPAVRIDYERSFLRLRALPAEIFLASHAEFYGQDDKRLRLAPGTPDNPFVDPVGYRRYLDRGEARLRERLAAEGESRQDADRVAILAAREESNAAIARRDLRALAGGWVADLQVTSSSGAIFGSAVEMSAGFVESFADPTFVTYVRTPESVLVGDRDRIAGESGRWVGRWDKDDGVMEVRGTYLAQWRREPDGWRVRSEVFVATGCSGSVECGARR